MSEGFLLQIDEQFLSRLTAADAKIQHLAAVSEQVEKRIVESFTNMGAKGVGAFIRRLHEAQTKLSELSKSNIDLTLTLDTKNLDQIKEKIGSLGSMPLPLEFNKNGAGIQVVASKLETILNTVAQLSNVITTNVEKISKSLIKSNTKSPSIQNDIPQEDLVAIEYSKNANTIANRIEAVKMLQRAMYNLSNTDEKYAQKLWNLNEEFKNQTTILKKLGIEVKNLQSPKVEVPPPDLSALNKEYQDNQTELERLQTQYDAVVKKILEAEKQIENIRTGKGGSYNPKEYQANLQEKDNLAEEIKLYKDENNLISEKITLLNKEYKEKVKTHQATDENNIEIIKKEKQEYAKLLKTLDNLNKVKAQTQKDIGKYDTDTDIAQKAVKVAEKTEKEIEKSNKRKVELEEKLGDELLGIQQAHAAKELELFRKNEEQKALELQKAEQKALGEYKKLANERNRLLNERYSSIKIATDENVDDETRALAVNQQKEITALLEKNKQDMLSIENKYQQQLQSIKQKVGQQDLQRIKRQNEIEKREIEKAQKEQLEIYRRTPDGALEYSRSAKTINQKIQAIQYLRKAQQDLDVSTREGSKTFRVLNKEIRNSENELERLGFQLNNFQKQSSNVFDLSGQLARSLSLIFSVSQITQYTSKMINIRKEMELQQRSLQVLLQSKEDANELWNQTLDLAVKSPFRVKELVTYTKQLAAYRIETEKLYDTNKMLADVSAGLGVDMQRLILAFGQVKAASVLRGTELRQFTEAGIPMLEELSKYFEEIYGHSVNVAEVFDMISKRMVTFKDVEEVFKRMTSAGGVFFNMQEELSMTTAGMISNLQDSIDLMFNEIGKKNQGTINSIIKGLRKVVENWETLGQVISSVLGLLVIYKAATINIENNKLVGNIKNIANNIKNIFTNNIPKSNAILTGLSLLATAAFAAYTAIKRYKQGIEDAVKSNMKLIDSVNKLSAEFFSLNIHEKSEDIDEYKSKLNELVRIAQQNYNIEIDFTVKNLETIDEVQQKFNELKEEILAFNDFSLAFDVEFAQQNRIGRGNFLNRGIKHDIEKLEKSQNNVIKLFNEVNNVISPLVKDYKVLNEAQKEFVDTFTNPKKGNESNTQYFKRRFEALYFFEDEYRRILRETDGYDAKQQEQLALESFNNLYGIDYRKVHKTLNGYEKAIKKLAREQENLFKNLSGNLATSIERAKKNAQDEGEELTKEDERELAEKLILTGIRTTAITNEWAEETAFEFYKAANEYFSKEYAGFNIIPVIQPPNPIELKEWQNNLQKLINENIDKLDGSLLYRSIGVETTPDQVLANAEEAWRHTQNLIKRVENARKSDNQNVVDVYKDEDLNQLRKRLEFEKEIWKYHGGIEESVEDEANEKVKNLKDQISLIQDLYKEYQDFSKEFDAIEAKEIVAGSFASSFEELGLNIEKIDYTNLQGILDFLISLESQAKEAGAEASQALYKAIGETSAELNLLLKVQEREDTAKAIQSMFSDYEVTMELQKLDVPENLAVDLFDINWTQLDDIEQRLLDERKKLEAEADKIDEELEKVYVDNVSNGTIEALKIQAQGNKNRLNDLEQFERQYSEIERKATEERIKTYYKYLLNEQHERVKIRLETLKKLQEIEMTNEFTSTQKATIKNKLKAEEQKLLAQQSWKDFEQTPMYMQMFGDIENLSEGALEDLINKMRDLKTDLQEMGLPASEVKEIFDAINKAEDELQRRNPFKDFAKNAKYAFENIKEIAELEEKRIEKQNEYDNAKKEYDKTQKELAVEQIILENLKEGTFQYDIQKRHVDSLQENTNELYNDLEKISAALGIIINKTEQKNDDIEEFQTQLQCIGDITKTVVDGIFNITNAMSWLPEETKLTLDRLQAVGDSVFSIADGIGSIMAGDVIGGVTQLISGIGGLISVFIQWGTGIQELNIRIEQQGRALQNLEIQYDRLNKQLDKTWDIDKIIQYNNQLEKNLRQQIAAQQQIVNAQQQIKGADRINSEEWLNVQEAKQVLQELYDSLGELGDNVFSKITGGIIDDVMSVTESWIDAWYEAFKETGDGLKGLEENFNDMFLNLIKRQAAMMIAEQFVSEWQKVLQQYSEDGLTPSEIKSWADIIKADLPDVSSFLNEFYKSFEGVYENAGDLSGLQRGVHELTETTGQEIAAYLNNIRMMLQDNHSLIQMLVSSTNAMSNTETPMLAQLRIIAQQTTAINTLLNSLTAPHPTLSGRGLKVVI